MNFQARKQKILEKLESDNFADVKDLAELLEISDITIRRDLAILAEQGLLIRTHGGAMKMSLSKNPVSFVQKAAINAEQKDAICQIAANKILEEEVVFLDCGSTIFRMCQFIRNMKIKVVTNSLPIVNELLGSEVNINFAGGELNHERQATHGKLMVEHFSRYRADKAFIGIDGISLKSGLSANSELEAETALCMSQFAKEVYFLCDSSKLETERYFPFAEIGFVKNLITDTQADMSIIKKYRSAGINVLY